MKVILTGATGFVGAEILKQMVVAPEISGVTCLTRRPFECHAAKVRQIRHHDFGSYPESLLRDLASHDACLWAIGGKASDLGAPDYFARVTHDFTLALATGIAARAARPLTFGYLSGMGADPAETTRFPWEKLTRHLKGRTERHLLELQERYPAFRVHNFRPGGILPAGSNRLLLRLLTPVALGVEELAAVMIGSIFHPEFTGSWPIVSHRQILHFARMSG